MQDERNRGVILVVSITIALMAGATAGFFLDRGSPRAVAPPPGVASPYAIAGNPLAMGEQEMFRWCADASGRLRETGVDFSPEEVCFEVIEAIHYRDGHARNASLRPDEILRLMLATFRARGTRYEFREAMRRAIDGSR